ncbi:MAG: DUF6076 domain-containing protein [Eubacteriales bacterium]|nr:DUF6076 domain-containing protein [Eubacteriales bacterium]
MSDKIDYFSASFRDGRIYIAGKSYPAGNFCVHLLNQYYKNDTAARIAVYVRNNRYVAGTLKAGYLNPTAYVKTGEDILHILDALPKLKPFGLFDTNAERNRIAELFTEENAELICDYLRRRAKVAYMDEGAIALDVLPTDYDKAVFEHAEQLLSDIKCALRFYDSIGDDIINAFEKLKSFVSCLDEAERFDEAHLLPIATEIFGSSAFSVQKQYVALPKLRNRDILITAQRISFESYYSFIITDFFEGLHYGHYPRQCEICKKYFLMQSARRQKYCNGYSDISLKGKRIACRKAGAMRQNTEKATDHPYIAVYKSRTGSIRVDKSRGNISEEFAVKAQKIAKDCLMRAKQEPEYARKQYLTDMQKDSIYRETARLLNK